jgi:transcriptional regulator with XRE-family HTH domain
MGRAGKALKKVMKDYKILQNRLALIMGIDRSNVSRWVNESRDPSGESIVDLKRALTEINPSAADDFVKYFLYADIAPIDPNQGDRLRKPRKKRTPKPKIP